MHDKKTYRGRILVVEDEAYVRASLGEVLRSRGYDVNLEGDAEGAMRILQRSPVDLVLTDLRMPGASGLDLVRKIRAQFPGTPVVVLTGYGTIASAVECVREGACDYVLKPADPDVLEVSFERALLAKALQREVDYLRNADGPGDEAHEPVGSGPAWQKVMRLVRAAAPTDSTILLTGESGTGKELLARLVHRLSPRSGGAYIRVNCAAIPIEMWESEFFGHRKGSFTGATGDREGRFRMADRGTLLLDEVGAMPLSAQGKILRVLQDGEFDRLGDREPTRVDVRIVAATNSDLDVEAASGRFRQDLFYRLNVIRIEVPPLRERLEDIPLLVDRFVRQISARLGRQPPAVDSQVLADLTAYPWPGNVRELRNVLERALILNQGDPLESLDLPAIDRLSAGSLGDGAEGSPRSDLNIRAALATEERTVLVEALKRSGGVRKEAARLLGIDQRNLAYYLKKHGVDPDSVGSA